MVKKNDEKNDIIENNNEVQVIDEIKSEPVVLYAFDQAYRLFLKEFPQAKFWTIEAVKVFCKKRLSTLENSIEEWFNVLKKY